MALRVRPTRNQEEFEVAIGAIDHYFGGAFDSEAAERFGRMLHRDRLHAAFDEGRDRRRCGGHSVRAQHSGRAAALCRCDRRRRPADTSPPRDPRSDDAGAARRRSGTRGAGRRALGLGGDDLRALRLRPREPGCDDPGISSPRRTAVRPAGTEWDDAPRRPRRGGADLPAHLRPCPATVSRLRLANAHLVGAPPARRPTRAPARERRVEPGPARDRRPTRRVRAVPDQARIRGGDEQEPGAGSRGDRRFAGRNP